MVCFEAVRIAVKALCSFLLSATAFAQSVTFSFEGINRSEPGSGAPAPPEFHKHAPCCEPRVFAGSILGVTPVSGVGALAETGGALMVYPVTGDFFTSVSFWMYLPVAATEVSLASDAHPQGPLLLGALPRNQWRRLDYAPGGRMRWFELTAYGFSDPVRLIPFYLDEFTMVVPEPNLLVLFFCGVGICALFRNRLCAG